MVAVPTRRQETMKTSLHLAEEGAGSAAGGSGTGTLRVSSPAQLTGAAADARNAIAGLQHAVGGGGGGGGETRLYSLGSCVRACARVCVYPAYNTDSKTIHNLRYTYDSRGLSKKKIYIYKTINK